MDHCKGLALHSGAVEVFPFHLGAQKHPIHLSVPPHTSTLRGSRSPPPLPTLLDPPSATLHPPPYTLPHCTQTQPSPPVGCTKAVHSPHRTPTPQPTAPLPPCGAVASMLQSLSEFLAHGGESTAADPPPPSHGRLTAGDDLVSTPFVLTSWLIKRCNLAHYTLLFAPPPNATSFPPIYILTATLIFNTTLILKNPLPSPSVRSAPAVWYLRSAIHLHPHFHPHQCHTHPASHTPHPYYNVNSHQRNPTATLS